MSRFAPLVALLLALVLSACAERGLVTAPMPEPRPPEPAMADRVVVLKGARELRLMAGSRLLRSYAVALGFAPEGHKARRGDGRTPEGSYVLDWRNEQSAFHRSINISYPSPDDRARAAAAGVHPGGQIMIHGLPNGRGWIGAEHARYDWTEGCIAVTNDEMDEIWAMVADGTPIEIKP